MVFNGRIWICTPSLSSLQTGNLGNTKMDEQERDGDSVLDMI